MFLFNTNNYTMKNTSIATNYYPKPLSKGIIRIIAVTNVNGYEIVNEFIPDTLPGRYNTWVYNG